MIGDMGLFRWLVLVCLFLPAATSAELVDVVVSAEGVGETKKAALVDALSGAVGKVSGVDIRTRSSSITEFSEFTQVAAEDLVEGRTFAAKSQEDSTLQVEGRVKSYEVERSFIDGEGVHHMEITAVITKYNADASASRKKIALTQTKVLSATRLFDVTRQAEIRDMLDQAIESQLVQSRKFAVLTRRNLSDMSKELNLIASDSVNKAEKAKLGQMLGGDYILIPEIADANASFRTQTIQVTGQTKVTAEGGITLGMRVITAATGEIKFSDTYTASASQHPDSLGLIQAVADAAVSDLVERIFPARVISTTKDDFVINFGGDTVQEGALYRVFTEGEAMIDPYTGESLGAREQEVALAEIYRVEAKVAYARVVAGGGVNPGMVARRDRAAEAQLAAPPPVKSEPKKKGVKLPFD